MQIKDEREYLENELKSYRKINDMYYKYDQQIENANAAKKGISSPHFKEVICENAGDPYKCMYNELDEEIKIASHNIIAWRERKQWIEERLSILNDTEYRIIKYRYIMSVKATHEWIADIIPCHVNSVKPTIDKILDKMLKVCVNPQ